MSDGMNGGSGEGGEDPDESLSDVFNYLKKNAKNGIAINGILVWIDVQLNGTAPNVWKAQAAYAFLDEEIDAARSALWKAAGDKKELIGEIIAHKSPGKKEKNIEDIHKAMTKLKDNGVLPMLLSTNKMIRNFPVFHCDKDTMNVGDVMNKVRVLEDSMNSFMKQNCDQMQALTESIGAIGQSSSSSSTNHQVPNISISKTHPQVPTETPGKKRRIGEVENMEGITEIQQTFAQMAKRSVQPGNGQSGFYHPQQQFLSQQYQQAGHPQQQYVSQQYQQAGHPQQQYVSQQYQQAGHSQQQFQQVGRRVQPTSPQPFPHLENHQKGRPRRPSTLVTGNAKNGKDDNVELLAADVSLVATGVSKDATADMLKDFISNKGIKVNEVELLTNHKVEARTFTYRVVIALADYEKALNPEVWPYRVGVRHFKPKRFQPEQNTWQQQASQTGGIIQNQQNPRNGGQPRPVVNSGNDSGVPLSNRYSVDGFSSEVNN